ncbi:MAG: thioredoxin family protein, partial [Leptospiraceae bacterium]|nr:thioredoxin family protein [Leptospiraceae bacterium]
QAKQSGQNVFVVITAPTWCGYCKMLERDVFAKDSVHSVLNSKFVALRILDSNPDKSKFNFRGYPTMMVANSSGQILTQSIPRREDSFLTALKKYETSGGGNGGSEDNKPLSGESYNYSIKVNGTFKRTADGQWIETKETTGEKVSYKEVRRDSNYIVIQNVSTKTFLALPVRSSKGFIYENGKWKPYLDFSK